MNRWYMNNKASSLDWELPYGDRVELYEHLDGTGRSLAVGETVLSRLEDPLDGVRNQISSFKWKDLPPEREELGTAVISLTNRRFKQDTVTRYDLSGTDPLPKGIVVDGGTVTVDLTIEEATNVAVETTKEFFYTATTSISVEIFAATIEVSFEVGATDTKTRTIENSHNDTLGFGREYTVPPGSEWHLVGTVQKGTLDYGATIPVTRWYKLKVPNSEYDAGLWRLKLSVPVLITGTKSSNLHFDLFRCGIDGNTVKDEGRPLIKRG